MIAECAGLPGAGKSTICEAVTVPYDRKGCVPRWVVRPRVVLVRAAYRVIALAVTAKPFSRHRLRRAFKLLFLLRHYHGHPRTILLDQGVVQKTWSLLADAHSFSDGRCAAAITALRPYAADVIIWVETPLEAAVERLASRSHGNSRYDGLPTESARTLLTDRSALLRRIALAFVKTSGATFIELDGHAPPVVNAARIDAILGSASDVNSRK